VPVCRVSCVIVCVIRSGSVGRCLCKGCYEYEYEYEYQYEYEYE